MIANGGIGSIAVVRHLRRVTSATWPIVLKNSVFEPAMIISALQGQQKNSDTEGP